MGLLPPLIVTNKSAISLAIIVILNLKMENQFVTNQLFPFSG